MLPILPSNIEKNKPNKISINEDPMNLSFLFFLLKNSMYRLIKKRIEERIKK